MQVVSGGASVQREARQAAAITLKNFIFKYWEARERGGVMQPAIFEADQAVIRENILEVREIYAHTVDEPLT